MPCLTPILLSRHGQFLYRHFSGKVLEPGNYAAGTQASLQNDESGNPTWIVSGHWKASLTNVTKAGTYTNSSSQIGNQASPSEGSLWAGESARVFT